MKVSRCCGAPIIEYQNMCSHCKEYCDAMEIAPLFADLHDPVFDGPQDKPKRKEDVIRIPDEE
jgi:hypothetical protein